MTHNGWWDVLEQWNATAFLTAGVLFFGTAMLFSLEAAAVVTPPVWATGLPGLAGLTAAFVGVVGLYPGLADWNLRAARLGLVLVILATIGMVVFPLCLLATSAGVQLPVDPLLLLVAAMIAMLLVFALFGVACLRSDAHSRAVGGLLLVLVTTFAVSLGADLWYGGSPPLLNAAVTGSQAVVLVATGHIQLVAPGPSARPETFFEAIFG